MMTTLRLTVTQAPPDSPLCGLYFDVSATGSSLGRGAGNACVLPDSERIVSSKHASISQQSGQFVLTDLSTNGTFVNGSAAPVGPSNSVPLKEGDVIAMGKYRFAVSVKQESAPSSANSFLDELSDKHSVPAAPAEASDLDDFDKWLEPQASSAKQEPLWGASNVVHGELSVEDEIDPLAAIDLARKVDDPFASPVADEDPDWWKNSQKDDAPALNQAFDAPRAAQSRGVDPQAFDAEPTPVPAVDDADDLDALLGLDSNQGDSLPAYEPEPETDMSLSQAPPVSVESPASSSATTHQLSELLGLGDLSADQAQALTPEIAAVIRQTVSHLLDLLRARSSIKNELRLDRTMIQPLENNPLKFALTEKDAVRYLFGEQEGAYLSGERAVKEAFEDIAQHQLALLAGMRSAYESMLAEFSPEKLERRLGEAAGKGLLSNKKARLWDAYEEYFVKLQQDSEASFTDLFGEAFADAYESQINNIKAQQRNR